MEQITTSKCGYGPLTSTPKSFLLVKTFNFGEIIKFPSSCDNNDCFDSDLSDTLTTSLYGLLDDQTQSTCCSTRLKAQRDHQNLTYTVNCHSSIVNNYKTGCCITHDTKERSFRTHYDSHDIKTRRNIKNKIRIASYRNKERRRWTSVNYLVTVVINGIKHTTL